MVLLESIEQEGKKERIGIFGVWRREGVIWLWEFVAMWERIRLRGARGYE